MAKYKKRADGRYATSIIVGYSETHKPKRKTFYGKTIKELETKVAEFRALQNKGIVIDDKSLTVKQWSETWLNIAKKEKEYNTKVMYSSILKNYINPIIGTVKLSQLKKHMLQECIDRAADAGYIRTAEIVRQTVEQLIHAAIDEQYLYVDITRGLTVPKRQKTEKRALTKQEEKAIDKADLTLKQRALIMTMLCTGVRRGELLALTPDDVDFRNNVIHINKAVYFEGNQPQIKPPKSDAGYRDIPMPTKLRNILTEYLKEFIGAVALFPMAQKNTYMTATAFRRIWGYIKDACKFGADVTPHILRHTYASKLYESGIGIKKAQYFLGHSSIQMTLDVYTHIEKSRTAADTAAEIDKVFNL